jgi:hypothetical protein
MLNKDGFVVLPHHLSEEYADILKIANHCSNYLTLLRYFDLREVVEFISFVNSNQYGNSKTNLERHFETIDNINMTNIKMYYITLLKNILPEKWAMIYRYFREIRSPRIVENNTIDTKGVKINKSKSVGPGTYASCPSNLSQMAGAPLIRTASQNAIQHIGTSGSIGTSGIYVTTKDAYTLTAGPTIFISNDVEKIAKFCIQQANIPSIVMDELMKKIEYNNVINEKLAVLES